MIVKPSVSFLTSDSDPQLIVRVGGINTNLTDNPAYQTPPPAPALPIIQAALDDFAVAVDNALAGGPTLTAIKRAKRKILVDLLRMLASYVQVQCNGDMAVLLSSGFPPQKPQREPIGILPVPDGLNVTFGPRSGELTASVTPVIGAAIYNWRVSLAAAPNTLVQTGQSTATTKTFDDLTPGVVYNFEANAMGAAGPSGWTAPFPQMAV